MIFFYYLPGLEKHQVTRELVAQRLGGPLRDCLRTPAEYESRIARSNVSRGPDGSSGTLLFAPSIAGQVPANTGYFPDEQCWIEIHHSPLTTHHSPLYLGYSKTEPPTPDGLRREHLVSGYDYTLGDGQVWHCPTIRRPPGAPQTLPQHWGVDRDGHFAETVAPDYAWAWELAGRMWDIFVAGAEDATPGQKAAAERHTRGDSYRFCVDCLSVNYRLADYEVSALQLLTSTNYSDVFGAALEVPLLKEIASRLQKKSGDSSAPEPPSIWPGPPADCATTAPAEPPCTSSPPDL